MIVVFLPIDLKQDLFDLGNDIRIKTGARLIQKQEFRLKDQGSGQRYLRFLAA